MSSLADDQAALLRALVRHGVEFVVIGGVAAQIHGWQGATADLDVAVSPDDDNTRRLNAALAAVGAGPPAYGQFGTSFQTRFGRLEIVRRADGVGAYADWLPLARPHAIAGGLTIVVADAADVTRSKQAAGRAKDLASLPEMRADFERARRTRGGP